MAPQVPDEWRDELVEDEEALAAVDEAERATIELARVDPSTFAEYILLDEETGDPVWNADCHDEWHDLATAHKHLVLVAFVESGKALAVDTALPVPGGWTTMGALRPGDTVFAGDGSQTTVHFVSDVAVGRKCYRVKLIDGGELIADAEHQWLAHCHADRYRGAHGPRVVTTDEMRQALRYGGQWNWKLPVAGAVQREDRELPVNPYVLGVWLGNGDAQGPQVTSHVHDSYVPLRCIAFEGGVHGKWRLGEGKNGNATKVGIGVSRRTCRRTDTLSRRLKALGVINNKHIPEAYLAAGDGQRLELLRGLMDTDGSVAAKGRVEITQRSKAIADGILEIVRSLGMRATCLRKVVNDVDYWRVSWTPSVQVFSLPRKAERLAPFLTAERTPWFSQRTVVAIEEVDSVPVKCIGVTHPDQTFIAGRDHVVTHNSQHITIARIIWELGNDPRQQALIISKTKPKAEKFVGSIGRHIASNPKVRKVFPHLRPGDVWRQDALRVEQPEGQWFGDQKDYNVEAAGVFSDVLGSRYTKVVADDVLDWGNTFTLYQCEKVFSVLKGVVGGRIRRNGSFWFITNAWSEEDAAHRFGRMAGWYMHRASVEGPGGELTWPERWDAERIKEFEDDYGKDEADRQLRSRTPSKRNRGLEDAWILRCLENGLGLTFPYDLIPDEFPIGGFTVCGVDLASRKKKTSDRTVFFVLMVHPPEEGKARGKLQVLWILSGRMEAPEILENLLDIYDRYGCFFLVEDAGAQDYLRQLLALVRPEIPIAEFTTTTTKWKPEYGLGGVYAEFQGAWWIIPSMRREDGTLGLPVGVDGRDLEVSKRVQAWLDALRFFDPDAHTPDEIMASWFAREGGRRPRFQHLVDMAGDAVVAVGGEDGERVPEDVQDGELWGDLRGTFGR